jgi:hypothetical protein
LVDVTGDLYEQLGAESRSIFLFLDSDGSAEYIRWGVATESDLSTRIDQLIAS